MDASEGSSECEPKAEICQREVANDRPTRDLGTISYYGVSQEMTAKVVVDRKTLSGVSQVNVAWDRGISLLICSNIGAFNIYLLQPCREYLTRSLKKEKHGQDILDLKLKYDHNTSLPRLYCRFP
jgi:hypothetical protein